jgi:hypothetical protein
MMVFIRRLLVNEDAQDLVEYVLLGATVAFVGLVVMNNFDNVMNAVYTSWDGGSQAIWEPQDPATP